MISDTKSRAALLIIVCVSSILSLISFALWPVFLINFREEWALSNIEIGIVSGFYFFGYVIATPLFVGFTDKFDSKWIFVTGCGVAIIGNFGFAMFANGFWGALIFWTLVGAGLAGTYMPGLQILNARLDDNQRISAIPWYTSCFGLGTGSSYLFMGTMFINFDYRLAAITSVGALLISLIFIIIFVESHKFKIEHEAMERHPLDFRPVFRKSKSMGYILAYGAHTFELFAYRSWSVALLFFIGSSSIPILSVEAITTIVSLITLTGMIASILGAKLAQKYFRHDVITIIGLATFFVAILSAILIHSNIYLTVLILWIYNFFIMLDSGALTAGAVQSSEQDNRGAVLAVHSMVGFAGGALGGPLIGAMLDIFGGNNSLFAWQCAIVTMGLGSLIVFVIQFRFRSNKLK